MHSGGGCGRRGVLALSGPPGGQQVDSTGGRTQCTCGPGHVPEFRPGPAYHCFQGETGRGLGQTVARGIGAGPRRAEDGVAWVWRHSLLVREKCHRHDPKPRITEGGPSATHAARMGTCPAIVKTGSGATRAGEQATRLATAHRTDTNDNPDARRSTTGTTGDSATIVDGTDTTRVTAAAGRATHKTEGIATDVDNVATT